MANQLINQENRYPLIIGILYNTDDEMPTQDVARQDQTIDGLSLVYPTSKHNVCQFNPKRIIFKHSVHHLDTKWKLMDNLFICLYNISPLMTVISFYSPSSNELNALDDYSSSHTESTHH